MQQLQSPHPRAPSSSPQVPHLLLLLMEAHTQPPPPPPRVLQSGGVPGLCHSLQLVQLWGLQPRRLLSTQVATLGLQPL